LAEYRKGLSRDVFFSRSFDVFKGNSEQVEPAQANQPVSVGVWFSSKKAPLAAVEVRGGCSCHAPEIKGQGGGHVRLGYIKILGHIS